MSTNTAIFCKVQFRDANSARLWHSLHGTHGTSKCCRASTWSSMPHCVYPTFIVYLGASWLWDEAVVNLISAAKAFPTCSSNMGHLNLVDMLARCYTMDEHVLGRRGCPHKPVTIQKLSQPHLRFKSRVSLFANSHHWTPPRDPGLAKEGIPDRVGFLRFRDPLSGLIQSNGSGMLVVLYLHAANTRSSSKCIWCIAPSSWPQSPIWWLWFRIFDIVLCRVIKIKLNQ